MASTLAHGVWPAAPISRHRDNRVDDPLDPMRGVVIGTLLSLLGFWLPLALLLLA